MTRHPDTYEGQGDPVFGDVNDPGSLAAPLEGVDVAVGLHACGGQQNGLRRLQARGGCRRRRSRRQQGQGG